MIFARLSAANVYYRPFNKLQKRSPFAFQITIGSEMDKHYGKYGELFEGPEAKPLLDNDEIAEDVGDAEKARDSGNAGDRGYTVDAGGAEHTRDA